MPPRQSQRRDTTKEKNIDPKTYLSRRITTNLFELPFLDGVLYGAFYAAVTKGNKEVVHSLDAPV
jgi:hypothetical protein